MKTFENAPLPVFSWGQRVFVRRVARYLMSSPMASDAWTYGLCLLFLLGEADEGSETYAEDEGL